MLLSFLVYGLFAFILWWLGTISAKREQIYLSKGETPPFWLWDIVFALLIFAIISGIRWEVGVDHQLYLEGYRDLLSGNRFGSTRVEFGFEFISNIFASLELHYSIYFGFLAFVQIFFFYYAIKNERYLLPFIGIVIIWGPHYLSWMNGMRQMIVACVFVYSIQFIKNRKLIPYVITILLASTIHRSALLLLILYFIPQIDYFKNRYLNLGLLVATLYIGMTPYWLQSLEFIEQILMFLGYEWYAGNIEMLIEEGADMSVGPRRIGLLLLNAMVIWYAPKMKEVFKNTNYLIYFNFTFIGVLLYNLFAFSHHIFRRPVSYFTIFLILTTSYLLYYFKPDKKYIINVRFAIVFILAISFLLFSILADYVTPGVDHKLYQFFFFQDT